MNVLLTGGFDPLHTGHANMIVEAAKIGDVIIGLNSDDWLIRKKGYYFMKWKERHDILTAMRWVTRVFRFDDSDDSAVAAIEFAGTISLSRQFIFANGGDRLPGNTPEIDHCLVNNIPIIFGLGGGKVQSSSTLTQRFLEHKNG